MFVQCFLFTRHVLNSLHSKQEIRSQPGRKKPRSDCLGQVNFALGQVKMKVNGGPCQWACEIYLGSLDSDNFQSKTISKLKTTR